MTTLGFGGAGARGFATLDFFASRAGSSTASALRFLGAAAVVVIGLGLRSLALEALETAFLVVAVDLAVLVFLEAVLFFVEAPFFVATVDFFVVVVFSVVEGWVRAGGTRVLLLGGMMERRGKVSEYAEEEPTGEIEETQKKAKRQENRGRIRRGRRRRKKKRNTATS